MNQQIVDKSNQVNSALKENVEALQELAIQYALLKKSAISIQDQKLKDEIEKMQQNIEIILKKTETLVNSYVELSKEFLEQ